MEKTDVIDQVARVSSERQNALVRVFGGDVVAPRSLHKRVDKCSCAQADPMLVDESKRLWAKVQDPTRSEPQCEEQCCKG